MLIFKKIFYLLLAMLFFSSIAFAASNTVTDYHQTFFPCYNANGDLKIAIRTYYLNNVLYYLAVNPQTFATETAPAESFKVGRIVNGVSKHLLMSELLQTPYVKALMKYTSSPYVLENYGITHAEKPVNGMFLTIDMCPASKSFESGFFNALVAKKTRQPISIALAVSGRWIVGHPQEFNWLIQQIKENKLKITWVNHSFSHAYYIGLPAEKNFLLEPHTNQTFEILATEKLLLEHGQLPSVFFRFPGLISNEKFVLKLQKYGLIPIGADAWLAQNQEPKSGSFILVHGNSNEPEGIKKIMPLLQNPNYQWLALDEAFLR